MGPRGGRGLLSWGTGHPKLEAGLHSVPLDRVHSTAWRPRLLWGYLGCIQRIMHADGKHSRAAGVGISGPLLTPRGT